MVKFKVGKDGSSFPAPSALEQQPMNRPAKLNPSKAPKNVKATAAQVQAPIDGTETSTPNRDTEGLRNQVGYGLKLLNNNYYGLPPGEPTFLSVMVGNTAEQPELPEHVVSHHAKLYEKDLGLSRDRSRQLVADLATVLS